MKTLVASALLALTLLSNAAQAYSPFHGYPGWARDMFERTQHH